MKKEITFNCFETVCKWRRKQLGFDCSYGGTESAENCKEKECPVFKRLKDVK